jgi:hypothetical protein
VDQQRARQLEKLGFYGDIPLHVEHPDGLWDETAAIGSLAPSSTATGD